MCVCEGEEECCVTEQARVFTLCVGVCVLCIYTCTCVADIQRIQGLSHRSHCCDPAPGAGTQSRAPLTGGSTISHSSADGPVYSATQKDKERVSR